MPAQSKAAAALTAAGFAIVRQFPGARWFEVIDPLGQPAAVLVQSASAWHWFARDYAGTASGCNAASCHRGGLGDAIGTDSQMRTYCRLILQTAPRALRNYAGVAAAERQAYAETV